MVAAIASKAAAVMAMRIIGVAIGRGFEGEGPHSQNFRLVGPLSVRNGQANFQLGFGLIGKLPCILAI